MKTSKFQRVILLVFLPLVFAACASTPASKTAPVQAQVSATAEQAQDAWMQARAMLPDTVALYQPAYVPSRFGPPELLEATLDPPSRPRYTIVYSAPDESIAFILNEGKHAFGNFPPPERQEELTVGGLRGLLLTSTETHTVGFFWQGPAGGYQLKIYSEIMSPDEVTKIIESLKAP